MIAALVWNDVWHSPNVMLEPSPLALATYAESHESFIDHMWPATKAANDSNSGNARLRKDTVLEAKERFVQTVKCPVARGSTFEPSKQEIERAYTVQSLQKKP